MSKGKFCGCFALVFLFCSFLGMSGSRAATPERLKVSVIIASNEGRDIALDNDAYRDQMIRLFSYSAYRQVGQRIAFLQPGIGETVLLPEGYELILTLQSEEAGRYMIHALIQKEGLQYVDTVLAVSKPGVVFLGGPPAANGALIIVLEMIF